ncbi:hypothetical protein CL628_03455 [bacterium]|nr:hypothetical protein [bacterium]
MAGLLPSQHGLSVSEQSPEIRDISKHPATGGVFFTQRKSPFVGGDERAVFGRSDGISYPRPLGLHQALFYDSSISGKIKRCTGGRPKRLGPGATGVSKALLVPVSDKNSRRKI